MIPSELVDFVHGPHAIAVGTRDDKLMPNGAIAIGAIVDAESDVITVFVADAYAAGLLDNLNGNRAVAMLVGHGPKHETFQFKGVCVGTRPSTEQEKAIQEIHRTKLINHFKGGDGRSCHDVLGRFPLSPEHRHYHQGHRDLRSNARPQGRDRDRVRGGRLGGRIAVLPEEIKPAMQGVLPSLIVTCALDGTPNTTVISQVYYVDETHVALSHQFFNKTYRNVRENPNVVAVVASAETCATWALRLLFNHSETEGPIFDEMDMQIEAIASMTGMTGIFKLKAADIYEVKEVHEVPRAEV